MPRDQSFGQARAEIILRERMKELDCLHNVARIIARKDLSLEEFLQAVVQTLPSAFLYPEVACARICFKNMEYQTSGFQETLWRIGAELRVRGEYSGSIDVFYTAERPARHDGPFLEEECLLLETAATFVSFAVESRLP